MTAWCSLFPIYVALSLFILSIRPGNSLLKANGVRLDSCHSRCRQTNKNIFDCMKLCSSVKKRSVDGAICDDDDFIFVKPGELAPGLAEVCVEYILDKSEKLFNEIKVSWNVPNLMKENKSTANVEGFFLHWEFGAFGETVFDPECLVFPKNVTSFIFNSSHLPPEKMNCDFSISLAVQILPLSPEGGMELKQFYCRNKLRNATEPPCVHWNYSTKAPTFQLVPNITTQSPSQSTLVVLEENTGDLATRSGVCASDICKYAVAASSAGVLVIIVLIAFLVRRKRKGSSESLRKIVTTNSKDFCYVSYFHDDGRSGDPSRSVINFLMHNGLRTVAVNILTKADLQQYYTLGPRKFGELHIQHATHVIVLVTKKYLDLCSVYNNAELDKERRRVFEEINYIDRAQLEPPLKQSAVVGENITDTILLEEGNWPAKDTGKTAGTTDSPFQSKRMRGKRFVAVLLDTSSAGKLPTWMSGWPIFDWPKEKSALLQYVGLYE